ncbi:MAG: hypothetical protein ACRDP4_05210, partial [Nocardioidaceae bacterium]
MREIRMTHRVRRITATGKTTIALAAASLAIGLSGGAGLGPAGADPTPSLHPSAAPRHQVATWGASADRTSASVDDQTVRNIVHT